MQSEDIAANLAIGQYGADSIELKCSSDTPLRILTHCNTGSLATAGFGTALGEHSLLLFTSNSLTYIWFGDHQGMLSTPTNSFCPGHDVKLHPHFHCHW